MSMKIQILRCKKSLNSHFHMSPEMAIGLSIAFKTSAESQINQQAKYDLWLAEKKRSQLKVKCLLNLLV